MPLSTLRLRLAGLAPAEHAAAAAEPTLLQPTVAALAAAFDAAVADLAAAVELRRCVQATPTARRQRLSHYSTAQALSAHPRTRGYGCLPCTAGAEEELRGALHAVAVVDARLAATADADDSLRAEAQRPSLLPNSVLAFALARHTAGARMPSLPGGPLVRSASGCGRG